MSRIWRWWIIVKLTRFRITLETHFWACLWMCFQKSLLRKGGLSGMWVTLSHWLGSRLSEKEGKEKVRWALVPLCLQTVNTKQAAFLHCSSMPSHHNGLYPLKPKKTFHPQGGFVRSLVTSMRKVISTVAHRSPGETSDITEATSGKSLLSFLLHHPTYGK